MTLVAGNRNVEDAEGRGKGTTDARGAVLLQLKLLILHAPASCVAVDRKSESVGLAGYEATPGCCDTCSGKPQLGNHSA